jgi:hypothetical protein
MFSVIECPACYAASFSSRTLGLRKFFLRMTLFLIVAKKPNEKVAPYSA